MRFLCFFLLVALLAACSPSPAQLAVQTASAETVIAASWTKTPTSTLTPTVTSTSTSTPTSTPAPTITATPTPMGLGVTRTDIQSVYEKLGLTFDPPKTENGIPYTVGGYIESASGNQIAVIVVINGHSANLREASVTVLLPPNLLTEPETGAKQHARALSYIQPLLDTIIPAWNQRSEWLDTAFRSFGNSSESKTSKQTTYRNFDILLEAEILREMGAVSIVLSIQVIK